MDVVDATLGVAIGTVLVAAGLLKLVRPEATSDFVGMVPVRGIVGRSHSIVRACGVVEFVGGVVVATFTCGIVSAVFASLICAVFLLLQVWLHDSGVACNCFGRLDVGISAGVSMIRASVLLVSALSLLLLRSRRSHELWRFPGLGETLVGLAAGTAFVFGFWLVTQLHRIRQFRHQSLMAARSMS